MALVLLGVKPAVPLPPIPLPPKVILLAKTAGSLNPDPTDVEVELTGKSQASSRRLCAKELEHIPKEMIAKKQRTIEDSQPLDTSYPRFLILQVVNLRAIATNLCVSI